jgi:type IV pilus assembly protein PilM
MDLRIGDFFRNLLSSLPTSFSSKEKGESVVGIDIGSSSIKVVQLRNRRGTAVLETYGELALGPYMDLEIGRATNLPPDKLAEALKDVLREANVTTKACAVSIPFSASLVSLIEMPQVPERQLNDMVPIEARKYVPVPISEVMLDWFVVPQEEMALEGEEEKTNLRRKIEVLLVAIHNETISKYQELVKAAELSTSFFEIEVFGSVRSVLERGVAPVAVIDMGAATTKLYLVEHGVIRESHSINRGAQDITLALSQSLSVSVSRAEELKREFGMSGAGDPRVKDIAALAPHFIFAEAERILINYQQKQGKNVTKAMLVGGGALLKGVMDVAKAKLSLDVALGDPVGKTEAPAFLEKVLREAGPEFAVAVGVALRKLQEEGR